MVTFDDQKDAKKLERLKDQEAENLAQILAGKYNLPYTDLSIVPVSTESLTLTPEDTSRKGGFAIFGKKGKTLQVALLTPNNEVFAGAMKTLKERGYSLELYITGEPSLENAWERYKEVSHARGTTQGTVELGDETLQDFIDHIHSTKDVTKLVTEEIAHSKGGATHILDIILAGALATKTSDIHLEPFEEHVRIRYRLDGVLQEVTTFDHHLYRLISSRIKLMSGLKLNVKGRAQDGRFTIRKGETDIEIRTSILPGAFGDTVVLRILNPETVALDVTKLGMDQWFLDSILKEVAKPNGMILITGPTGSGKTTTLYSFLTYINKPGVNILTIEDPIEYRLPGINQSQAKKGFGFAEGLRSAMRQDPDVMMVGEIRDSETAKIAVDAALTGHIVFSTLHTNNAAGAIPRLLDLEVDIKVLGDALTVAIAQRLVRKLCHTCREQYQPEGNEQKEIEDIVNSMPERYKKDLPHMEGLTLWKSVGCDACNHTGYKGREGVYEGIFVDETVEQVILSSPAERDVWKAAGPQEMLRMREHGLIKVFAGITDFAEVKRVVDTEEE